MKRRCMHCRKEFETLHALTLMCSDDCRRDHMRRYQATYRERAAQKSQPPKEQDHGRAPDPRR